MKTVMALVEQAGREASLVQHRLFLVNISIYLDKFMRAGYQQAADMLYISNIRTQEGNKARTKSMSMAAGSDHTPGSIYFDKMAMSY